MGRSIYRLMVPDFKLLLEIHYYEKCHKFNAPRGVSVGSVPVRLRARTDPFATAEFRLESTNCFIAKGSSSQGTALDPKRTFFFIRPPIPSCPRSMKGNETSQKYFCLRRASWPLPQNYFRFTLIFFI